MPRMAVMLQPWSCRINLTEDVSREADEIGCPLKSSLLALFCGCWLLAVIVELYPAVCRMRRLSSDSDADNGDVGKTHANLRK